MVPVELVPSVALPNVLHAGRLLQGDCCIRCGAGRRSRGEDNGVQQEVEVPRPEAAAQPAAKCTCGHQLGGTRIPRD